MYGLVNRAVEGLVLSKFGEEAWKDIKAKAGVEVEEFVSMQQYPDAITYDMVGAASEVLGLEPAQVLHAFGVHWVLETAAKSYGPLMEAAGATLPEFLGSLDQLHSRVAVTFPQLRPPSFRVSDAEGSRLRLHYYSEREGLAPFVVGLLDGLG